VFTLCRFEVDKLLLSKFSSPEQSSFVSEDKFVSAASLVVIC